MKDKRQRIAVAWPYAAVYADPTFAASLLQAAANSVGMPYGYGPNPMLPQMQVMAPQMQQSAAVAAAAAANHYPYGYRYAPYPIPQRSAPNVPHSHSQLAGNVAAAGYPMLAGIPHGYTPLSIPKTQTPPSESMQSPTSPLSSLSLSPTGSDKIVSPLKENGHNGLLMTSPSAHIKQEHIQSHLNHHHHHHIQAAVAYEQTTLVKAEKPKLFKPYKSEE